MVMNPMVQSVKNHHLGWKISMEPEAMMISKISLLFQGVPFQVNHVKFWGCTFEKIKHLMIKPNRAKRYKGLLKYHELPKVCQEYMAGFVGIG